MSDDKNTAPQVDINLLNEVFEAVNKTTESLKSSYSALQKKLEQTQELLDSVLDNTRSAIIACDARKGIFLRNKRAKELSADLGEEKIAKILSETSVPGVHDVEDRESGRFFRLSVSSLLSDEARGFVYLMDDITRLKVFEQEKVRNEKLRLMGEMAANIAHEVRNPLGSIELYASLLSRDLERDAGKKRLAVSIIKGVRTINAVISNTLLFAKEIKINPSKHILSDIVDEVVLYLQHVLREKKAKFVNKLGENDSVFCDPDMYKQVVMNLISNSADAVDEGGVIKVESFMTDRSTVLIVSDNGCGIDKDMLSRLFMPFQTTKAKGTGLGLSIAYKIIKAHGGDITAESDGRSRTRFTVVVPIEPARAKEEHGL